MSTILFSKSLWLLGTYMKKISKKDIPELIGQIIKFTDIRSTYYNNKLFIVVSYNEKTNIAEIFDIEQNLLCKDYSFPNSNDFWELV